MSNRNILCLYSTMEYQVERCLSYLFYTYKNDKIYLLIREELSETGKTLNRIYENLEILFYKENVDDNFNADQTSEILKKKLQDLHFDIAFVPITADRTNVISLDSLIKLSENPEPIRKLDLLLPTKDSFQNISEYYAVFRFLWMNGIKNINTYEDQQIIHLDFKYMLDDFSDIHKNERCFIVGNGPSLKTLDMSLLKNEITFGCNRVYLGFSEWGYNFKYMTIFDRLQIQLYLREWEKNLSKISTVFTPFHNCQLMNIPNICPINFSYFWKDRLPPFEPNLAKQTLGGSTVHLMLQLAILMGCNPIIIIGVDNKYYINDHQKNGRFWFSESGENHFNSDYTQNGKRLFLLPIPNVVNDGYRDAANWCAQNGIEVINANPNSFLPAFKKIPFDNLF
jgi:hypothetical protein